MLNPKASKARDEKKLNGTAGQATQVKLEDHHRSYIQKRMERNPLNKIMSHNNHGKEGREEGNGLLSREIPLIAGNRMSCVSQCCDQKVVDCAV